MMLSRLRDPYISQRYPQIFYVLRVALALCCTYALTSWLHLPSSSWALVSTVMVMGNLPHIGGVLDKGRQRLFGSIAGALFGLTMIILPLDIPALLPLSALIGTLLALWFSYNKRYGYGALMFAISLLLVIGDGNQDLSVALWRSANVLLGTSIGILATVLVMPQKSTDLMRFGLADNLDQMAKLYQAHASSTAAPGGETQELFKDCTERLIKQRALIEGVHRERRLTRRETDDIISLQRRMLSTIELLLETHWNSRAGHDQISAMQGLRHQQHMLAKEIGTLAFQIRAGQSIDVLISPFTLDHHAELAMTACAESGRQLFSPAGYLWLNRELARLSRELRDQLGGLEHLPSQRLRRRAKHHGLTPPADSTTHPQTPRKPDDSPPA
ncbi:FUSC family protein [Halomonas halocynthiae]|uniref:FUSC family protein n=1 Tax=Halomonas halocynthiae TaxID=176290 RepID=UPI000A033837|nr:FUSC family protein [Halomonas halocynthiae]